MGMLNVWLLLYIPYPGLYKKNSHTERIQCNEKKTQTWLNFHYKFISVLLATVVEGVQKAPFSIATTPRCRGMRYSFPLIAPLYPRYVPYMAECSARRYQVPFLKSLVWRDLGLNPGLPDHWWTLCPLDQWAGSSPVYLRLKNSKYGLQSIYTYDKKKIKKV